MSGQQDGDVHSKRIERFQTWCRQQNCAEPNRVELLAYGANVGSINVLRDLEVSFRRTSPLEHPFLIELAAAKADHGRRSGGVPMITAITSAAWWVQLQRTQDLDVLTYAHVKKIDHFLHWLHANKIARPNRDTFLEYVTSAQSAASLIELQRAFMCLDAIAAEAILVDLPQAITAKRQEGYTPRVSDWTGHPRTISVLTADLPREWQGMLAAMRQGKRRHGHKAPALSIIEGIETALCQLGWSAKNMGLVPDITPESLKAYLSDIEGRTDRAATLEIRASQLQRFIRYSGAGGSHSADALDVYVLRQHKRAARQIGLKEDKARAIGDPSVVLSCAVDLFVKARDEKTLTWRMTRLNHALALALTVLLPLRVQDTTLQFGTHITWSGTEYWIDIATHKTGARIHGALPEFLTPFFDHLILQGRDYTALKAKRENVMTERRHVYMKANGNLVRRKFVSDVWVKHFGTGCHIARTLVHDTLGRKGVSGVAEALALCGQRDPQTAAFYQTRALRDAYRVLGTKTLEAEFSDSELEEYFPDFA